MSDTTTPEHTIVQREHIITEKIRVVLDLIDHAATDRSEYDRSGLKFRPTRIVVTWHRAQNAGVWENWVGRTAIEGVNVRKDGSDGAAHSIPGWAANGDPRWAWALDLTRPVALP